MKQNKHQRWIHKTNKSGSSSWQRKDKYGKARKGLDGWTDIAPSSRYYDKDLKLLIKK